MKYELVRMVTCMLLKLLHHIVYWHNNILLGVQQSIHIPVSTAVTTSAQSLLSADQPHDSASTSEWTSKHIISVAMLLTNFTTYASKY